MKTANAPLFKDPIHNGAADPVVIYNEETGTHYMLYTARRADVEEEGVMWGARHLIEELRKAKTDW